MCESWKINKDKLEPRLPDTVEEWGELPLWRPHANHKETKNSQCKNNAQQKIRQLGLNLHNNVVRADGTKMSWKEARIGSTKV
jgi:hypothetical protein